MSMPPGGQQWGGGGYPYPPPPPPKKSPVPWILAGVAVVVVAAVTITLVVTLGGDDKPGPSVASGTSAAQDRDLSSPEAAAESFADAVKGGDAAEVIALTCVGDKGCVDKLAADPDNEVTPEKIDKAKELIKKGVTGLAKQLDGAEFDKPRKASTPNAMEVPYRTPEATAHYLIFFESGGKWFYLGGGASHAPSAPPANAPG